MKALTLEPSIEFEKNEQVVSNDIVISLSEIYPGMETINEKVSINNLGDSLAQINYEITSARILDVEYNLDDKYTSEYIEDQLSHEYPFNINISLEKNFVKSGGDTSLFNVSISWPLDSGNDTFDSYWGTEAYKFQLNENKKHDSDSNYQPRSSIKIEISVNAEQHFNTLDSADDRFKMGDLVLYDIANNRSCNTINDTCIKTHVITKNSTLGDSTIELIPDLYDTYLISPFYDYNQVYEELVDSWRVSTRPIEVKDILYIISDDVSDTYLVRENLSNSIVGNLKYEGRITKEIEKATKNNGYYSFNSNKFDYLISNKCYWTNSGYNEEKAFAFTKLDENTGKVYPEDKVTNCSIIPIIIAPKSNI